MRKDFERYFTKLQLDFNKMQKHFEKAEDEYKKGLLTEDQFSNFCKFYNAVKVNYDRTSYVRFLLHKPSKLGQAIENFFNNNALKKELENYKKLKADEAAVLEENKEAIEKVESEEWKTIN